MRSLEVLIVRDNKIKSIQGPFDDLMDASEKQLKKCVMKLQLLDIRNNRLTTVVQKNAINFLKETVVLMWNNQFDEDLDMLVKLPRHIVTDCDDDTLLPNPLHLFTPRKDINDF